MFEEVSLFSLRRALPFLIAFAAMFMVSEAKASGPHEVLDCLGCHDPHYAKAQKLFKVKNEIYPNPRTGKTIDGVSGLCLGCHNLQKYGGAGVKPIYLHMTHPVNVQPNPRIANVPDKLLRDGIIQCTSCHDPHPSNPNWRYLRVDTEGGSMVGQFCGMCHGSKADKAYYGGDFEAGKLKVFSSFNEEAGPGAYLLNDPRFVGSNPTPIYIQPLGNYPNDLAPAYETAPQEDWVLDPSKQNVPADLLRAVNGERQPVTTEPLKSVDPFKKKQ